MGRTSTAERQAVLASDPRGLGMDAGGGTGTRRGAWHRAGLGPDRRRKLRSSRVLGAHEHHPPRRPPSRRHQFTQALSAQPYVAAALIALGLDPFEQAGPFEEVEMMCQQIARQAKFTAELTRR